MLARRPIAEVAQQYFAAVGIEMTIEEAPVATILTGMRDGTMDAALYNWTYGSLDRYSSVARVNTETGDILGDYKAAPVSQCGMPTPSRTTVDVFGNV